MGFPACKTCGGSGIVWLLSFPPIAKCAKCGGSGRMRAADSMKPLASQQIIRDAKQILAEKQLENSSPVLMKDLREIVQVASERPLSEWWAYSCDNGTQDLDRLSFYLDSRYEVQINRIHHSKQPHCHGCHLMSVILLGGYEWWLQQHGSTKAIRLFAAPDSVITMEPEDTHWIPSMKEPSVSLCVFDKQSDWHKYYVGQSPLAESDARPLLLSAQFRLKDFAQNHSDLF